jgi:hypothetical protein
MKGHGDGDAARSCLPSTRLSCTTSIIPYAHTHRIESSMPCTVLYNQMVVCVARVVGLSHTARLRRKTLNPQCEGLQPVFSMLQPVAKQPVGISWDWSHQCNATGCSWLAEVQSSLHQNWLKVQPVAVPVAPKKGKRPDSTGLSNTSCPSTSFW